jgi:hypothetical protein
MASPDVLQPFRPSARKARAPDAVKPHTLPDLLFRRVAETPDGTAFRWFDEVRGDWVRESWRGFGTRNHPLRGRVSRERSRRATASQSISRTASTGSRSTSQRCEPGCGCGR